MRQTSFQFFRNYKKSFGGSELIGKRKTQRPLSTKSPIHLILKSETHKIFRPNNERLSQLIFRTAGKFNIQIREHALNWSHIHFLIQIHNRQDYVRFIRALTSKLAMAVRKTNANSKKLFTLRPYKRIVTWGRDYQNTMIYIFENFKESLGYARKDSKRQKPIGHTESRLWRHS